MEIGTARRMLMERRQWWEATAEHMAEQATLDSESHSILSLALHKLQAVARHEKRLSGGTFGRCERCSAPIDDDRLEMILDDECHYCVVCAAKSTAARTRRTPVRPPDAHRVYPQFVGAG